MSRLNRLSALSTPSGQSLSREEHDTITETKLVRRRTQAAQRSENQPLSPPWDGKSFPAAQATAPSIRDGKMVLDGIRKNSLAPPSPQAPSQAPPPLAAPAGAQAKRFTLVDATSPPLGPNSNNNTKRTASPGRRLRKTSEHNNANNTASGRFGGGGRAPSPAKNSRPKLHLDDVPSEPHTVPPVTGAGPSDDSATPGTGKYPTTFAEMGFHGVKAEEKECIIM